MAVMVDEQRLGQLRWIVVRGPALAGFRELGAHMRAEIGAVVRDWDMPARLRRQVASPPGSERLAAVRQASEAAFPQAWAELAALAEGAGVPLADLAVLNFRGDIGAVGGAADGGGTGCSDLAWRGRRSFIAHNEDDSPFYHGRCALLTLALAGQPPVTAFWKPGFVPSNTFTVTGTGLVWAIDHLPVAAPGPGAGRHFVARGLQGAAGTVDQAIAYLRRHPSAGGYAYTIGDRAGRVVSAESSAGQNASREAGPGGPLVWHTNHGRYVTGADASPGGSSMVRGQVLAALDPPPGEPDAAWFVGVLARAAPPAGVRADPSPVSPSATLCTFVADLTAGDAVIVCRDAEPVTIPLADLATGRADRQRVAATAPHPASG